MHFSLLYSIFEPINSKSHRMGCVNLSLSLLKLFKCSLCLCIFGWLADIFPSPPSLFSFGWLVVILGGTDHWMREWQDEHGLGEEEDFHIDGWIMHNVKYLMAEGMLALAQRYIFDVLISDSITPCSWEWKRRYCGDSAAEWSQHQWKNGKQKLFWRNSWLLEIEIEMKKSRNSHER